MGARSEGGKWIIELSRESPILNLDRLMECRARARARPLGIFNDRPLDEMAPEARCLDHRRLQTCLGRGKVLKWNALRGHRTYSGWRDTRIETEIIQLTVT